MDIYFWLLEKSRQTVNTGLVHPAAMELTGM